MHLLDLGEEGRELERLHLPLDLRGHGLGMAVYGGVEVQGALGKAELEGRECEPAVVHQCMQAQVLQRQGLGRMIWPLS